MQTCNNIIKSECVPEVCSDSGRGIEEIVSNNDGHPVRTEFTSGAVHIDEWDGVGQHLSTTYMRDGATAGKRWYTGDGHVVRGGVDTDTLEMARFEGGFFDRLGAPFFYVTDYRGSVTAVLSSTGSVLQRIDYYPYGEPWIEPQPYTDRLKRTVYNKYAFGGKERLTADGINEYDQDARRYAASFPFFTSPDKLASKMPWLSPYIFCAGNPVNAIDPSGKLTIFINGMHGGSGASSEYWGGVDETVMKAVGETKAIYKDGSMGGAISLIIRCLPVPTVLSVANTSINPNKRILGGYIDGMMSAKTIKSELGKNEKIRFVSHSMGAAYTKGFIGGMKLILGDDIVKSIEFELDIAPYQPKLQKAVKGVKTVVLQHEEDKLALPLEMKGAEQIKKKSNQSILDAHSISSFKADIEKLFENY